MGIYDEAKNVAEIARRRLELDNAPIKDIFSLLQNEGIFLVRMPIDGDGLSGAFYYDKEKDIARILINSNRTIGHQIFTAAHEYGHYLLDREANSMIIERDGTAKSNIEKRADAFAVNFLMPEDGVRKFISDTLKVSCKKLEDIDIVKLRSYFGASWTATLYRLHNLGYKFDKHLDEKLSETSKLSSLLRQMGNRTEVPFREKRTILPAEVYQLAYAAYFDEKISLSRLADILRCSYDDAKDQVAEIEALSKNGQDIR